MSKIYNSGTKIVHERDGGGETWSTDQAPAFLLPSSNDITAGALTVDFPDFDKGNMAFSTVITTVAVGGFLNYYDCGVSFVTIKAGQWDKNGVGDKYLAPIFLGTVNSDVNHLDIRLTLSRTLDPSTFMGFDVPKAPKEHVEIMADGGFVLLEKCTSFIRAIEIERVGDNIFLNRIQSSNYQAQAGSPVKSDPQSWPGGPDNDRFDWVDVWTHGGDPSGHLAYEIEMTPADTDFYHIHTGRGMAHAPSFVDPTDYSSQWTISSLRIRQGVVKV